MKMIQRTYTGSGAGPRNVALGFVPRRVEIRRLGNANALHYEWTMGMARDATSGGGVYRAGVANEPAYAIFAVNAGIRPYFGGDAVAAAGTALKGLNLVYAQEVEAYRGDKRGSIKKWTLGHTANRTGNFDAECDTDHVGVGSLIQVAGRWAYVVALTSNGDQANETTLSWALPSGPVQFIGTYRDMVNAPVGTRMPAGITIIATTVINVDAEIYALTAWEDDLP